MSDKEISTPRTDEEWVKCIGSLQDLIPVEFAQQLERELSALNARLAEETAIVDRIWDQLGSPSYEELKGRSIHDLIDEALSRPKK